MTNADKRWSAYTFWKQPPSGQWGVRNLGGRGEGIGLHAPRIVLAVSIKEAYFVANNDRWANLSVHEPVGVLFDYVPVPPGSDLFAWHGRARCGHVLDAEPVIRLACPPKPGVRAMRAALAVAREHEKACPVSSSNRSGPSRDRSPSVPGWPGEA